MYIDIHTHSNTGLPHAIEIINSGTTPATGNMPCSVGIHPWYINPATWKQEMEAVRNIARASNVAAIGECGIDKLKSHADTETQAEILAAHARIAEEVEKPLILHCVKGLEEMIKLHRSIKPKQAWIIHGFRGKPAQAVQLLREGFYLSYGAAFNPESLIATPADRLLIESDTSDRSIKEIYDAIAACRGIDIDSLITSVVHNIEKCNIILQ